MGLNIGPGVNRMAASALSHGNNCPCCQSKSVKSNIRFAGNSSGFRDEYTLNGPEAKLLETVRAARAEMDGIDELNAQRPAIFGNMQAWMTRLNDHRMLREAQDREAGHEVPPITREENPELSLLIEHPEHLAAEHDENARISDGVLDVADRSLSTVESYLDGGRSRQSGFKPSPLAIIAEPFTEILRTLTRPFRGLLG